MQGRLARCVMPIIFLALAGTVSGPRPAQAQAGPDAIGTAMGMLKFYMEKSDAQQQKNKEQEREAATEKFRRDVLNDLDKITNQLNAISKHLTDISIFLEQQIKKNPVRIYHDQIIGTLLDLHANWSQITSAPEKREQYVRRFTRLLGSISAASRQTNPPIPYAVVTDIVYLEASTYALVHFGRGRSYPYPSDVKRNFKDYGRFFEVVLGTGPGSIKMMQARLLSLQKKAQALIAQMPSSALEVMAWAPAGNGWDYHAGELISKGSHGFYTIKLVALAMSGYRDVVTSVGNNITLTDEKYAKYLRDPNSLPNPHSLFQQNNPNNHWSEQRVVDSVTQQSHGLNILVQTVRRVSQDIASLNKIEALAVTGLKLAKTACCAS